MEDLAIRLGLDPSLADAAGLFGRLLLAAFLGGLIGLERELADKPAGLRTNLLICLGAALLMEVSVAVASAGQGAPIGAGRIGDPGRIAAQIVSGVGFLGAGTILQSKGNVTGLTTAATIWVVAAIGMAVGAGAYVEALGTTLLVFMSLVILSRVDIHVIGGRRTSRYILALEPGGDPYAQVQHLFQERGMELESETIERTADGFEVTVDVTGWERRHRELARYVAGVSGVRRVSRLP